MCWIPVVAFCLGFAAVAHAQTTNDPDIELANIKTLDCTFKIGAQGTFAKDGTVSARVKDGPELNVRIRNIDAADGVAELVSPTAADAIVQLYGWNLHIMEASRGGRFLMTTVFGRESENKRLKAVYTRTDYLPIDLPGFISEPEATQYYGDCAVTR
jgi:hypothetical protein